MSSLFDKQKAECLGKHDLSRKGSIDEPIVKIIQFINDHRDFFSLSSCSGRIVVFAEGGSPSSSVDSVTKDLNENEPNRVDPLKIVKAGCDWIHVAHATLARPDEVIAKIKARSGTAGSIIVKFEPFILHVQCRNLDAAKRIHTAAVEAGYRNSGLTQGRAGKLVAAVRSTHGLEVPLSTDQGMLLVSDEYIEYLLNTANAKLQENFRRIAVFEEKLFQYIDKPKKPAKERKVRQANTLKAKEAKENLPPAADDADKETEENNWEEMLIHGLDILL